MNDLRSRRFGYLVALEPSGKKGGYIAWKCLCDCGNTSVVSSNSLTMGNTRSCGCQQRKRPHPRPRAISKEEFAHLYYSAKTRAKKSGLEFTISIYDIEVPLACPVLGLKLEKSTTGKRVDSSPSLDRIDNSKGYTKDNTRVISWRANKLKSDASIEELEAVLSYMKENDTRTSQK